MRTFILITALFSILGGYCKTPKTTFGRDLPRCEIITYPTAEESQLWQLKTSKYLSILEAWRQDNEKFSTEVTIPFSWANRQVILHVNSASSDYELFVNDKIAAYNNNPNTPAEFNITKLAKEGRNQIEIRLSTPSTVADLESFRTSSTPALGSSYLMSPPTMQVRDVLTKSWDVDGTIKTEVALVVRSNALNPRTSRIYYDLRTPSNESIAVGHEDLTLDMRREDTLRFVVAIPQDLLWHPQSPTQLTLNIKTQHEGRYVEYLSFKQGFSALKFDKQGGLSINNKPITLYTTDVEPNIGETEIVRMKELGYNTLRLKAGVVPTSLYKLCDQLGVFVIAQAAINTSKSGESRRKGGNPTNNPKRTASYIERANDSYHTSKRHPSVIAFSIADKSSNGINLYESYLDMKTLNDNRPIIYRDAGAEWNSDKLQLVFAPEGNK